MEPGNKKNKKRKALSSSELSELASELNQNPRAKANNVAILISSLSSKDTKVVPAIHGLKLFFVGCFEREELVGGAPALPAEPQDPKAVYAAWLHRQFTASTAALLSLLGSGADSRVQVASLAALMEFTRGRKVGVFDNELFFKITAAVAGSSDIAPEAVAALLEKYTPHADVRYHFLRAITTLCTRRATAAAAADSDSENDDEGGGKEEKKGAPSSGDFVRNVFDFLSRLPPPSEEPFEVQDLQSWSGAAEVGIVAPASDASGAKQRKRQRRAEQQQPTAAPLSAKWASAKLRRNAYSDAWLAFLRCELPGDVYRKALARLHDLVLPNMVSPLLLSDFLTHSLDRGGLDGMLALNGIFILVTQHGLEYPKFYDRLYQLLTPDSLLSRSRLRFFQLADIFLASPMVPAYTAAAFAKRFARLALAGPPAGALIALTFIHNLLRRHPACVQLIHRAPPAAEGAAAPSGAVWRGEDVYDEAEADPAKARALESTLWEVTLLRRHANPAVSNFCAVLDKDLSNRRKTAELDVSDVLSASYASLFTQEVERRLKTVPTAFYAAPPTQVMEKGQDEFFPGWTA